MLILVKIGEQEKTMGSRMVDVLAYGLANTEYTILTKPVDFLAWIQQPLARKKATKFLFAIDLGRKVLNEEYIQWANCLLNNPQALEGCSGAVVVDGAGELFTKKVGREFIFLANQAGCSFPGRPLIEATGSLYNFTIRAQLQGLDNMGAYRESVKELVQKLLAFSPEEQKKSGQKKKNITVIHASIYKTSNTILLWNLVKEHLGNQANIEEISLRNGEVIDCRGCNYETCLHYGEQGGCFYGGVIVEKVYPAIYHSDAIVLLCPNYNDAVSANLTAFINRLTALFRKNFALFAHKKIFALVVSGYSGGDIVTEQIIDAMNCNKNFILPGNFALVETANAPQSILQCQGIRERALLMAQRLLQ